MEGYIPSSDAEESQASQLVQNVLRGPGSNPSLPTHRTNGEYSVVNESVDSSATSRTTNAPSQYRLHGLAETQPERDDKDTMNETSHKENIKGGSRQSTNDEQVLPLAKNTRAQGRRQEKHYRSYSPTKELRGSHKSSLKDSFVQRNTSGSRGVSSSRARSPSEMSEDSFAGDDQDPEQQYLATTKQFQVPLSELVRAPTVGRGSAQDTSVFPSKRVTGASHDPSDGKILAPDSDCSESPNSHPLKTARSRSLSRHHTRRNRSVIEEEPNSQNSNSSDSISVPGSSLYELRDREPPADDFEATQPTNEPEEEGASIEPDPPWLLAAAKASGATTTSVDPTPKSSIGSNETRSSASSNRGLISLIHPGNAWRFQRYQQIMSEGHSSHRDEQESNPAVLVQEPDFVETQPSYDDGGFSKPPRTPRSERDRMDVVPDSSAALEERSSIHVTSTDSKGLQPRPATNCKRSPQPMIQEKRAVSVKRSVDDTDSDDDIPLAKKPLKPQSKGKERENVFKVPSKPVRTTSRAMEPNEVPSSVPEQDAPKTRARGSQMHRVEEKEAIKKLSSSRRPLERLEEEAVKKPSSARRPLERLEEEEVAESEDEAQIKRLESEELDEEYQDANDETSRKRKRGMASTKAPASQRKGLITRGTKSAAVVTRTASIRQAKRQRSMTSSAKATNANATRVFALWRQDGHFYSGTVHMLQEDNRYLVKFDDETEGPINLEQMRTCQLHVGDNVLLPGRTRSSKVRDASNIEDNVVMVETDGDSEEVELRNIRIASRTIKSAWKDRFLAPEGVVPAIPPIKRGGSPTPSGVSLVSAQSNKSIRKKFLCKTGLVVSLSAGNANLEKAKESLLNAIRNNGGVVLEDWTSVVKMEGKHSANNNRWVLNKDEVQWNTKEDIERVFLLADDSTQKPKFLMAIGLGIPCLSLNWLHDSIAAGEEKEWTAYMLPQGYSDRLSARISQQVDVDWGNSVHQLTDIMDNTVPAKPLNHCSILCVGSDMVPQPKSKKPIGYEKAQESSNTVARIITCMGARRVEAVTELRYASTRLPDFHYVVVKDSCTNAFDIKGSTVVSWSWVKDCLIASRRLALPEDEDYSQEA